MTGFLSTVTEVPILSLHFLNNSLYLAGLEL